ncbi:MAG: ATP-binding protein, partial [Spirochaetales bacterium]|nr:ATP-binding protein [Spirochaetales bacterium]
DVFRFLRDVARSGGGLQEGVRLRGGLSKIRCLAARAPKTDVEIEVHLYETESDIPLWKYSISLTQKGGGAVSETKAIVRYEKVWKNNELILERPNEEDENDEELKQYTHLEQPTSNGKFRDLADFFKSLDYQHIIPQLIRDPSSFQRTGNKEEFFGRDLLEKLSQMPERKRNNQLNKIEKALKYAVPHLKNLELIKDKMGIPHLQAVYEHWRPHGAKQDEDQFSDGTLRLIGLLFAMQNGIQPLLLEEPELSLNSGVVQKLAEIIYLMQKRKSGKRQVILSTHSYDLLNNNGISAKEIVILKPVKEGTSAENADSIADIRNLLNTGLTPAEVVLPHAEATGISGLTRPFQG